MPVIHKEENSEYRWGIWQIEESESELLRDLPSDEDLRNSLATIKVFNRKIESIATRALLNYQASDAGVRYNGIWKDKHGKPFLIDEKTHISISHSYPYAAAMLNLNDPVGIDLEHYNKKILKLETKFMSEQEIFDSNKDPGKMILVWAAKEALYKSYGRKNLSFKDNIEILPFEMLKEGILKSKVKRHDEVRFYELEYKLFPDFVVCYTL